MTYAPGHFSAPVRRWPGLNRYECKLAAMLVVRDGKGAAELAQSASEQRQARLNSDNPDTKWSARGTVPGLGKPLFIDKPPRGIA